MNFVLFYHSLLSDWNHGNAHFLRGVVAELLARGHSVRVYEPEDGWSLENLRDEHGDAPIEALFEAYPMLRGISRFYDPDSPDLDEALDGADVVIVHEWNEPEFVAHVGRHRARGGDYTLLFHDTHHRVATEPEEMAKYELSDYDGVLAFGRTIRDLYRERGWADRVWTWHEAADTRLFRPVSGEPCEGDLVWIGNWGDDERSEELIEFLLEPVERLGIRARVHGVRYPVIAQWALERVGIDYAGWVPNFRVPETFARFRATIHIPRQVYVEELPGIPTIRPFEALACGIPLISAPWDDAEGLFTPGEDYLVARDGVEMECHLRTVLHDPDLAHSLAEHGRRTIEARHTCAHRVDELMHVLTELRPELAASTTPTTEPVPTL
jgi:spore maturation protein CgeB